jgi:signal recognition particle subunit SRP54
MLDNLSKGLSNLIRKIVTGTTIDKKSVEDLLQDLRRILLQSDVDVKLTDEMIENIKKKCFVEKIPAGLTLREHVLKVIYEELVRLLGEKPAGLTGKKRIMVVGLFGSGKCIHKDSLVNLSNGEILKIETVYENYRKIEGEEKVEDGYKIELKRSNLEVFSFNPVSLSIEKRRVSTLWKLNSPRELIKVNLDNGKMHEISVTPEHPFYTMDNGIIKEVRADELKKGDRIAVPNFLPVQNKELVDMRTEMINKLSGDFAIVSKELGEKIKKILLDKYGTLEKSYKFIKPPFSYSRFTHILNLGVIPFDILRKINPDLIYQLDELKIRYKRTGSGKEIKIPKFLNSHLAEFLGYVLSGGSIEKNYIHITNSNNSLVKRIVKLAYTVFGLKASLTMDKKRLNVKRINLSSKTLVNFFKEVFEIGMGKKSPSVKVPKLILISPTKVLNKFIKSYFDGGGSIKERHIEISSTSKEMIWQIGLALLRSNIFSTYSYKKINGKLYYRLFIRGIYAEKFASKISSDVLEKKIVPQRAKEIGEHQFPGKLEIINVGSLLQQNREAFETSISEIQNYVDSCGAIERYGFVTRTSPSDFLHSIKEIEKRPKWVRILKMAKSVVKYDELLKEYKNKGWLNATLSRLTRLGWVTKSDGTILTTEKGLKKLEEISNLEFLFLLANSNVSWIEVKKVGRIKSDSKYVYDLTVDDLHNFVANGIIVHNTTSVAKVAKYLLKQGLKPALVGLDYHRPAATDQIVQLGKQIGVPVYVEESKDPYSTAKNALQKFTRQDVLIFDTAGRNALDKELADELKRLGEIIKPDEVLLTIPADLGKVARVQSEEFHKLVGVTGVIITKMDGTAKAGGALAATSVTGAKVKFIGVGEHVDDLELYNPERFVSRLLGLGDLQTLLEKAKEAEIKPEKVEKIVEGEFTLQDFYEQIEAIGKMGSLQQLVGMIPGFGMMKIPENLMAMQEEKLKKYRVIIQSLTPKERANPSIIDSSRIKRCAKGAGVSESDVRELLSHYSQIKKVAKLLKGRGQKDMMNLIKKFGGKLPFNL